MGVLVNILVEGEICFKEEISNNGIKYIIYDSINQCEILKFRIKNINENDINTFKEIIARVNKTLSSVQMEIIRDNFLKGEKFQFEMPKDNQFINIIDIEGELNVLNNILNIYNSSLELDIY